MIIHVKESPAKNCLQSVKWPQMPLSITDSGPMAKEIPEKSLQSIQARQLTTDGPARPVAATKSRNGSPRGTGRKREFSHGWNTDETQRGLRPQPKTKTRKSCQPRITRIDTDKNSIQCIACRRTVSHLLFLSVSISAIRGSSSGRIGIHLPVAHFPVSVFSLFSRQNLRGC